MLGNIGIKDYAAYYARPFILGLVIIEVNKKASEGGKGG